MKTAKLRYFQKFRPTLSPKAESSVCFGPASVVEKLHSLRFGPMAVISAAQNSLQPETADPSSRGTFKGILKGIYKGSTKGLGFFQFPKIRVPYLGVLIIRILLFRVLYWGPLFSETPTSSVLASPCNSLY